MQFLNRSSILLIKIAAIVCIFSLFMSGYFHFSGSTDRTIKFWDLETFELIGSAGPEVILCLMVLLLLQK